MPKATRSAPRPVRRAEPPLLHRPRPRRAAHALPGLHGERRQRLLFHPEPSGGARALRAGNGAPRVLVADDEGAIRMICRVNLESSGMTVLEASDGSEALELVRAERPTIVLLDVMMPNLDGWAVAERLAEDDETRDIPVVFLSARAGQEDRRQAQRLGAVGYIVKPFDPLRLGQTLEELLERIERGERERLRNELAEGR